MDTDRWQATQSPARSQDTGEARAILLLRALQHA
jgi:hypothetical protein